MGLRFSSADTFTLRPWFDPMKWARSLSVLKVLGFPCQLNGLSCFMFLYLLL